MRAMVLVGMIATLTAVSGCGGESGGGEATAATASGEAMTDAPAASGEAMKDDATASRAKGRLVKSVGSEYGRVVADGQGEAFYLFEKENGPKAECYGECARVWPPVLTSARPRAGKGVKASLLGRTRRNNGKFQVTYAGHPLYYYVDDSPGNILCQNVEEFGGRWLVVRPSGAAVT